MVVPSVSSCMSVPAHEATSLPARGGNDWDVPLVVLAVDEDELMPPAAYPKSARNSMKRMNPKSESVESSAMLCLDQYRRPEHLLAITIPIKRRAKQWLVMFAAVERCAKHFDHGSTSMQCQAHDAVDTETLPKLELIGESDEDCGQAKCLYFPICPSGR